MKLQSIQIRNTKTAQKIENIKRTIQGIKTLGYLLITGKNKVQTTKGQPKVYRSKTGLKLGIMAMKAKTRAKQVCSRLFNQSFVQVGIFESRIAQAKKALQDAKKMLLSTQEYFVLHVNLCKAYLHLRMFRYSLPKGIVNLLF